MPLKFLVDKFGHVRFEPSGWTGNPQIPFAKSIPDYVFGWMGLEVRRTGIRRVDRAGSMTVLRTKPGESAGVTCRSRR